MRNHQEISEVEGDVYKSFCDTQRVYPADLQTIEYMFWYLDEHKMPATVPNLMIATQASEIRNYIKFIPFESPENYREVCYEWINSPNCPQGIKGENGAVLSDIAKKIALTIAQRFSNHYSFDNLNRALAIVQKGMFGEQPVTPAPKKFRGDAAEILAQSGYMKDTSKQTRAEKIQENEKRAATVKEAIAATNRGFRFNEFQQALNSANSVVEYLHDRISHGRTADARKAARAEVKKRFPEFAADVKD